MTAISQLSETHRTSSRLLLAAENRRVECAQREMQENQGTSSDIQQTVNTISEIREQTNRERSSIQREHGIKMTEQPTDTKT